jgi:phosphoribosyl 1,2-cyclic phosphate phosphodiesterase
VDVTFLGTGTSIGIPVIGCSCAVCLSTDSKNNRLRPSILIGLEGKNLLIDTATDFRVQALRFGVGRLDAILFTHWHADHVFGLDDIRIFNAYQRHIIPCYGNKETVRHLRHIFSYAFEATQAGGGKPKVDLMTIHEEFELFGRMIEPVEVYHGKLKIFGYRLGKMAYVTDCSKIPEQSIERLKNLEVLILGALRYTPHPTHFTLDEALRMVDRLSPGKAYLTHLSHAFDHDKTNRELPENVSLAYDGLRFTL